MNIYEFLAHYGIIGLSIATAIGLSFNKFIESLTHELLMPLIGIIIGVKNIKDYSVSIGNQIFDVGIIISTLLSYIIILSLVIIFGYYVFWRITKKIRDVAIDLDKKSLEEQEKTVKLLRELKTIQKNKVYGIQV